MRCKVGDVCVIVNDMEEPSNNGRFVTIKASVDPDRYRLPVHWECEAHTAVFLNGRWLDSGFGYRDAELCPIRDPGPDAIDETIQRLGTPMDMRLRELENELAKMNESLDRLEKVLTR